MYDMQMFSRISRGKQENVRSLKFIALIEELRIVKRPSTRIKLTISSIAFDSSCCALVFWRHWLEENKSPCPLLDIWFIIICITGPWDPWNGYGNAMVWWYDVYAMHQAKMQGKKLIYWICTNKVLQGIRIKPCNEFKLLGKESKQVTQDSP